MPVPSANLAEAVLLSRPGASFKLDPETYTGLTMLDGSTKPTLAEIEAAWESRPNKRPVYSVTMSALRRALGRSNCIKIGAWIGGIQDVEQRHAISAWWEYSPTVRSTHPAVAQFQQVLNLTDDQADAIFAAAYAEDNA